MIKIRPHHLLCCLTFSGQGYTQAFIVNYYDIIQRIKRGELLMITAEPDDICQPVCHDPHHHCYEGRISQRDQAVIDDFNQNSPLTLRIGTLINSDDIFNDNSRDLFASGKIRGGCIACQWKDLCDEQANKQFVDSILLSQ
ncbi:DUF1284 domain-containing protein (plasmid) [Vibrio sp. SS-MA-C1-2]|uniref:DUF1284 domain-containing protein n=1 Tax=Vibrio sp. SS-MA-C1-2 TaxID=2908646 RepID=UPI001F22A0DF|nr:DUF1284 domain-containing protein [Vibrio sp. SS-MA-C1-2]UJF20302.1 DUF1284 domain-containing protein [Vibrio sp. SS-MA-C1-2]